MILLIDLDGTVADNSHRMHLIEGRQKDWNSFYHHLNISMDKPIEIAQAVLPKLVQKQDVEHYFLTGRPERTRRATVDWMWRHFPDVPIVPDPITTSQQRPVVGQIFMRADGDHRPACVYKEAWPQWFWATKTGGLVFVDDDTRNAEMYSKYGVFLKAPDCWETILV